MDDEYPTVLLDTNVIISGFIRGRSPGRILDAWVAGKIQLATSGSIQSEIREVLSREYIRSKYSISPALVESFWLHVAAKAVVVVTDGTGPLGMRVRDPRDAHVLAAALAGKVDYLVTGDTDLLVLDGTLPDGAPRIVTPAWFVREVLGD